MLKLVLLFVVLAVVAVSANPHPRQNHAKKSIAPLKHTALHHGPRLHEHKTATRVARSHAVHHAPGESAHHSNKLRGNHGVHGIHAGDHGARAGNKGVAHRPVKRRAHRK